MAVRTFWEVVAYPMGTWFGAAEISFNESMSHHTDATTSVSNENDPQPARCSCFELAADDHLNDRNIRGSLVDIFGVQSLRSFKAFL